MDRYQHSFIKALAGLSLNISAAWFALAFITPNFVDLHALEAVIVLTKDIVLGIVFLVLNIIFEQHLKNE